MHTPAIADSYRKQHNLISELPLPLQLFQMMEEGVASRKFTAWSCANSRYCASAFYFDEALPPHAWLEEPRGTFHPDFDLASLTKPLLVLQILRLVLKHDFQRTLHAPLIEILNPRDEAGKLLKDHFYSTQNQRLYTLDDFASHRSGAPAWFWFGRGLWHSGRSKPENLADFADVLWANQGSGKLREKVCSTLTAKSLRMLNCQSQATTYSDINYFLLAIILQNTDFFPGKNWPDTLHFLNQELKTNFKHASLTIDAWKNSIPFFPYFSDAHSESSAAAEFSSSDIFGPCHDTNASILAGLGKQDCVVSGHAGLFGNIMDVQQAVDSILLHESQIQEEQPKASHRFVRGLDTPSDEKSLAGLPKWPMNPSQKIRGHLGFTGTSFWGCISTGEKNIILTNRTAQRIFLGAEALPRLFVFTEKGATSHSRYFIIKKNAVEEIDENEALETAIGNWRSHRKIWNRNQLCTPADISSFRREGGKLLWMTGNYE